MGKPVWILSLSLILLLALFAGYAYFFDVQLPAPVALTPIIQPQPETAVASSFDPAVIYEQDLFSTYIPPQPEAQELQTEVKPVPQPPQEVVLRAPQDRQPRFVEPLPLTLTGLMVLGDIRYDRAIIVDNKTHQEVNYKTGDLIDDAQLVAIYPNRVLLVRSNGQQEYLYLTQEEITTAQERIEAPDWSRIVSTASGSIVVDKDEFAREVKNVSHFIDIFDLSSAYKNGKCIGAKVGMITETSLATALGFKQGDIVVKINSLSCTSTQERMAIIEQVTTATKHDTVITIDLLRNNKPATLHIHVERIRPLLTVDDVVAGARTSTTPVQIETERRLEQPLDEEKSRILRHKYKFVPSATELEQQERQKLASIKHTGT